MTWNNRAWLAKMADRAQIGYPIAMPKKKAPELTDAERAKRIKEMAREVEADEKGEVFKRFFKKSRPAQTSGRRGSQR